MLVWFWNNPEEKLAISIMYTEEQQKWWRQELGDLIATRQRNSSPFESFGGSPSKFLEYTLGAWQSLEPGYKRRWISFFRWKPKGLFTLWSYKCFGLVNHSQCKPLGRTSPRRVKQVLWDNTEVLADPSSLPNPKSFCVDCTVCPAAELPYDYFRASYSS